MSMATAPVRDDRDDPAAADRGTAKAPAPTSMWQAFTSRRMAAVAMTGFSSGLPFALTGATLQVWMTRKGVDLTAIGLLAAVSLPYTLKFLWSPLMDRFIPPSTWASPWR